MGQHQSAREVDKQRRFPNSVILKVLNLCSPEICVKKTSSYDHYTILKALPKFPIPSLLLTFGIFLPQKGSPRSKLIVIIKLSAL